MNAITIPGDSLFGIPDVSVAGFTGLFEWVESHIDSHIKVTYRDSRITLEKDDLSVTSYRHPRTGLIFIDSVPSASAPALIHAFTGHACGDVPDMADIEEGVARLTQFCAAFHACLDSVGALPTVVMPKLKSEADAELG